MEGGAGHRFGPQHDHIRDNTARLWQARCQGQLQRCQQPWLQGENGGRHQPGAFSLASTEGREDLTQLTDPRNLVTQYPRNGLGDATSLVSPDTGTAAHTYDAAGNLKTRTDSRGVLATYSYDALNRLTGVVYSQSGQTSLNHAWAYDQTGAGYSNGVGRLTSATHPAGSSQYTYDAQGRLLTETQRVSAASGANAAQVSSTVTYTYDAAGNLTSLTYPSGRKLVIGYTGGQPSAITLAATASATPVNLITSIQWEPFGGPRSWLWQMTSGTRQHGWLYDNSGRLVRQNLGDSLRDISYDAADRITGYQHYDATTGAAQAVLDQSFAYDELGRLTGITTASASWSIGYDANGNRTGLTLNGTTSAYTTASTSNRLTSITNPARSFGYDNAGNTVSDTYSATYNLAGRLATLLKAGTTSTYSVDGFGRRVRKFDSTGAASTVLFVYDQLGQLLGEYNSNGTAIREYVWLGNTPVAVFTPDPANAANPPLAYYIHTDHLATPRIVLNTAGQQRWSWLAEPFGTSAPNANPQSLGTFTFNLRHPGQYADAESGLFYNYFRDYDASTGRYAQSDPIGLQGGVNTYSYVTGNPLSYVDPQGLQGIAPTPMGPIPVPVPVPSPLNPSPRPLDPTDPFGPQYTPVPSAPNWWSRIKQAYNDWCEREECKADCVKQYERDAQECGVANAFWGSRGYQACMKRAGEYLGQCMKKCDGK
ncbi:RHS repeat domain-containing protein [Piscinibacter sp.]|uniref:RHS repeat domain-containing protein n=1 Tax=Piscinibacter sp. TaxID=1903157 RepID=UPI0039E5509C